MPFQIIRNDITKVKADAIVNTANPDPEVGGGTDTAIYQAAGWDELLEERKKIGPIEPGHTEYTPAFRLNAKYIFHTVGIFWIDGKHQERQNLRACYRSALSLAAKLSCESIAFPLLASGSYGYPKEVALDIARVEIEKFLRKHEMKVILVVFDRKAFELSRNLVGGIEEYIDEHSVRKLDEEEYRVDRYYERLWRAALDDDPRASARKNLNRRPESDSTVTELRSYILPPEPKQKKSLNEILEDTGKTFQQKLFCLIDEKGLDDVDVYKRANMTRQTFSKIRSNAAYKPKKKTAVALAIALQLDMEETEDLLMRAGFALSTSSKFDLIISYFIDNQDYDTYKINCALFDYGQPILGE